MVGMGCGLVVDPVRPGATLEHHPDDHEGHDLQAQVAEDHPPHESGLAHAGQHERCRQHRAADGQHARQHEQQPVGHLVPLAGRRRRVRLLAHARDGDLGLQHLHVHDRDVEPLAGLIHQPALQPVRPADGMRGHDHLGGREGAHGVVHRQ
ncbi:MAG: hypothetical protein ISP32_02165 [Thermoleophilia bacterium]|nr:hypothetical protein [Thermoleophilia bacterium]